MTRAQLVTALCRRLNKSETPDTATGNRLKEFINEVHRELLSHPGLQRLRDDTLTFASVANQASYALPWAAKVNRVFETTNDRLLLPMSQAQYRAVDPDAASFAGVPDSWIWQGYQPVAKQPSDASSLFIDSTSGSDTNTCFLEGETSGGYPRSTSVVMTGTTAVNVAASISDWVRVTKLYLSAAAVGTVTLHEDASGGTELARIAPGQTHQQYYVLALYPTPTAVVTYSADVTLGITDLAQDNDVPRLPLDFHDLLVIGAMAREYEKTQDERWQIAVQRYEDRRRDLLFWLADTASGTSTLNPNVVGWSRLGPYFPAGS